MTFDEFSAISKEGDSPPTGLRPELKALWYTRRDMWHEAHDVVNDIHTPMGSWIHAHLHRIEGDLGNAAYWYNRAGKPPVRSQSGLDQEWTELVQANL